VVQAANRPDSTAESTHEWASETDISPTPPPHRPAGLKARLRITLELIRANPSGRIALRTIVAILGALVVLIGLVLVPLPGPGWLIVIGGLAIWAVEFQWARRLLVFTRRQVQAWTQWIGRQSWPLRLVIGATGILFVATVIWLSLKLGLGIDLVTETLRYLATH